MDINISMATVYGICAVHAVIVNYRKLSHLCVGFSFKIPMTINGIYATIYVTVSVCV